MKNVITTVAILMCCGCASTGSFRVGEFDLDVRSEERVAIECAKPVEPEPESLSLSGLAEKIIDIIPLKLGRWYLCLFRVDWGEDE